MELGGQQSCSIPISGGSRMPFGSEHQRETALAAGCLAELILVALLALLLISLLSSAHSPGLFMDCLLTPFLHGTLLGHAAGIGSLLLLAKGLCTCPQLASGDAPVWSNNGTAAQCSAMGNRAPWEDGNAEEWLTACPSDQPDWPGFPGRPQ